MQIALFGAPESHADLLSTHGEPRTERDHRHADAERDEEPGAIHARAAELHRSISGSTLPVEELAFVKVDVRGGDARRVERASGRNFRPQIAREVARGANARVVLEREVVENGAREALGSSGIVDHGCILHLQNADAALTRALTTRRHTYEKPWGSAA